MYQAIVKRVGPVVLVFVLLVVIAPPSWGQVVVVSPGTVVAGTSVADWTTNWWRWAAVFAPPRDPFTDASGAFAGVNQSGPVFFLAGSPGGGWSRRFEVPLNTYILVPLVVGEYSQLELGFDKTGADIRQAAQQQADQIDSLHATLDGVTIPQATLFTHREISSDFNFVAGPNNPVNIVPPGNSGTAVADGYFLMIQPLAPGAHTLNYGGGASGFGVFVDETDTITVGAPKITLQPTNQTKLAGEMVTFAIEATGSPPLGYQWFYSSSGAISNGIYGQPISNADSATLTFTAIPSSTGIYWVTVTTTAGQVSSSLATLTVVPNPPTITKQPTDQAVFTGSNAVFSVAALSTNPPIHFQWQFNGASLFQATNDTLIIKNAQIPNIGQYSVIVGDRLGDTTSGVANLSLLDRPPFVVSLSASQLVAPGSNATLMVEGGGAGPLAYQWQFDSRSLPGATAATLVLTNVQLAQAGSYSVILTNNYGSTISGPINLRLGWIHTYNGIRNGQDAAQSVAADNDGNVVVTGYSSDGNNSDYYTAKYAANSGSLLWGKTATNGIAAALALDANGNVLVTGSSGSFDGSQGAADYLTIKYAASDGELLWEKRYNGPANNNDYPFAIAANPFGNAVVTGYASAGATSADFYTAMYSATNGSLLWERYYNGLYRDTPQSVAVDKNGNVVVAGYAWNGSNDDAYTAKYSATNGALLWEKQYDGPSHGDDRFQSLVIDNSNNVVVTGFSGTWPNYDFYTAKYSGSDGALIWEKRYDGPAHYFDTAQALAVDALGNVTVTGVSDSDFYTAKYASANGTLLWEKRYDAPAHGYDYAKAVVLDPAGNAIVSGSTYNTNSSEFDCYTIAYASADGAVLWDYRLESTDVNALTVDSQGNVIVAGSTGFSSGMDYLVMKIFANQDELGVNHFTSIVLTNGNVQLEWASAPGLEVQRSPTLDPPDWQTVSGSANTNRTYLPAIGASGYFRLFKP